MKQVRPFLALGLVVALFFLVTGQEPESKTTSAGVPTRVSVSGESFGIKVYTDGVLVVGLAPVQSGDRQFNPSADAGIKVGDVIKRVNKVKLETASQLSTLSNNSKGKVLKLSICRGSETKVFKVKPRKSTTTGTYKLGLWVRDSTAGIGTITYYDTAGNFAALGHGMTDVDTHTLMPLDTGEAVGSEIIGLQKSTSGSAGELYGVFKDSTIGDIKLNTNSGLYGKARSLDAKARFIPVATKSQIHCGKAKILTTLDTSGVHSYSVEIVFVNPFSSGTKDMVVKVTDQRLISKTGGIVQGMSGSPIVQSGRFVGALTHVFVNSPTKGYAISGENMLKYSQTL